MPHRTVIAEGLRFPLLVLLGALFLVGSAPLTSCGQDPGRQDRAPILAWIGQARNALEGDDPAAAHALYERALAYADSSGDAAAQAVLYNLRGALYEEAGRYQEALIDYERGLDQLRADGLAQEALEALQGSGKTYRGSSGAPVSADLYRGEIEDPEALLRRPEAQAREDLAVLLALNAANMYLRQSQYTQADSLYAQVAARTARRGSTRWRQMALTNLGWSAIKSDRPERARVLLDSVLSGLPEAPPHPALRRALLALGVVFRMQGQYARATAGLEQAAALYRAAGDDRGYARTLAHLATAHFLAGDYDAAQVHYTRALALNASVRDPETAWHAHGGLAATYQALGDYEPALTHYAVYVETVERVGGRFTTDQGRISFLEDQAQFFEGYARAALHVAAKTGVFDTARQVIERLRGGILASLQQSRMEAAPEAPGILPAGYALFGEQWSSMEAEYASGTPHLDVGQTAPGVRTREDRPGMEGTAWSGRRKAAPALDPAHVPAVTFLEYFVLSDRVAIFLRSPGERIRGAVAEVDADTLDQLIAAYGRALEIDAPRGVTLRNVGKAASDSTRYAGATEEALSRRFYELLVAPVAAWMPSRPDEQLVIIPHRSLWLLPFAALRGEDGTYFGDRHLLTYADSEASWRLLAGQARRSDHRNLRAWIVGDPQMPDRVDRCGLALSFHPLPGAAREAEAIYRLMGPERAELFVGSQADRLRLEAWHSDYSVLHLATHGFACLDDPLTSFVVLSAVPPEEAVLDTAARQLTLRRDPRLPVTLEGLEALLAHPFLTPPPGPALSGILDADAIINRFHTPADLVTLSACQTGLGRLLGQGTVGFTRAFLAAGARSVLVSLWRVDDAATEQLMTAFYRAYLRHGHKARALQQAMAETRAHYPNPRYWAAFTLVGLAE